MYGASKLLAYAATRLLAAEHARSGTGIVVSGVCPGFVRTRMTGPMATLTPAQGSKVIARLAARTPAADKSGCFWTEEGQRGDIERGWRSVAQA